MLTFLEHRIADHTRSAADPQVADGRSDRGRRVVGDGAGSGTRGIGIAVALQTSTCTTCSTCGPTSGGGATRGVTWSSRVSPTITWSASSVGRTHQQFLAELRGRLAKFGLELAAEKTRLIEFGKFAAERRQKRGLGKPETFQFLGFTHICGKSRTRTVSSSSGSPTNKRARAKLHKVKTELSATQAPAHPRTGPMARRAWFEDTSTTTPCPATSRRSTTSAARRSGTGTEHFGPRSQRTRLEWKRMWPPCRSMAPRPLRSSIPGLPQRLDALYPNHEPSAVVPPRWEYARHDEQLGGASPLWRLMAPTTSRWQLLSREAGWGGSRSAESRP